jgi:hypothetical protein
MALIMIIIRELKLSAGIVWYSNCVCAPGALNFVALRVCTWRAVLHAYRAVMQFASRRAVTQTTVPQIRVQCVFYCLTQ